MILPVHRSNQVATCQRFFRRPKRPEAGPCSEISADPTDQPPDQPPGRILTTPVETDVEAGLMVMIPPGHISPGFLHIRVHRGGGHLILLEAVSQILLEVTTTDREKIGPGRRSNQSN